MSPFAILSLISELQAGRLEALAALAQANERIQELEKRLEAQSDNGKVPDEVEVSVESEPAKAQSK